MFAVAAEARRTNETLGSPAFVGFTSACLSLVQTLSHRKLPSDSNGDGDGDGDGDEHGNYKGDRDGDRDVVLVMVILSLYRNRH